MLWIFLSGLLTGLALEPCGAQQATGSKFSCDGRGSGYYADVASGCQVYHMCDGLGRQFSYTCPNATLFQQRMLICDHWYMVNCSRAEDDYSANLLIGQQKPFVEDTGSNPFHRTPRPDLLTHPSSESEYNIIYRTGKERDKTRTNIVGAEQENEQSADSDEPTYFPPSHWSTAYSSQTSTVRPFRDNNENRRILNQGSKTISSGKKTRGKPKAINFGSSNRNGNNFENSPKYKNEGKYNAAPTAVPVSYRSNFRATTPVFPVKVEESSEPPNDVGVLPPIPYRNTKTKNRNSQTDQTQVNFKSNFPATTPVFPLTVEDSSAAPNDIGILPPIQQTSRQARNKTSRRPQVNFQSNFKATTPVFPLTVEEASETPNDLGIQPPEKNDVTTENTPQVNFKSNFPATTPVFPLTVDDSSVAPSDIGILPPDSNEKIKNNINMQTEVQVNFKSDFKATTPVFPVTGDDSSVAPSDLGILPPENGQVNFKSNFKATTPVYPKFVEPKEKIEISNVPLQKETHVNFYSDFKATTPVYPKSVEATSPDPGEVGLLPPQSNGTRPQEAEDTPSSNEAVPDILLSLVPPEFDPNFEKTHENIETTPSEPSMFYQPPKFDPDFTESDSQSNVKLGIEIENIMKSLSKEQWQNIRQRFHIPEYEFPLDDATRPSYDSIANSFGNKR
ncbi:uncharacterized protein LOC108911097 [Anoplophora glabripennis]|uniref:uncharacterized protein LOC108911097 n=1 Tax=Anoplophora glabripennis TaxID=217634 RepID=UPI0008739704|nr:uncharacterized protein LOC108911097 [Anoplophora glabripennis]